MKNFYDYTPGALLISYAVYSAFVPVTMAHSIILFSLAGLFGYSIFIHSQKQPSLTKALAKLEEEMNKKIDQEKEINEIRLKKAEDGVAQLVLASSRAPSSSSPKINSDKKIIF